MEPSLCFTHKEPADHLRAPTITSQILCAQEHHPYDQYLLTASRNRTLNHPEAVHHLHHTQAMSTEAVQQHTDTLSRTMPFHDPTLHILQRKVILQRLGDKDRLQAEEILGA